MGDWAVVVGVLVGGAIVGGLSIRAAVRVLDDDGVIPPSEGDRVVRWLPWGRR